MILSTLRAPRLAVEYIKRRSEVLADAGFPPEALHSFVASYAYFDGEWAGGALCGVLAVLLVSTTGPMMELLQWFARRRWTHEQGSSVEIVQTGSLLAG